MVSTKLDKGGLSELDKLDRRRATEADVTDFVGDPALRARSGRVGSGLVGSGRARVVEFSSNLTTPSKAER